MKKALLFVLVIAMLLPTCSTALAMTADEAQSRNTVIVDCGLKYDNGYKFWGTATATGFFTVSIAVSWEQWNGSSWVPITSAGNTAIKTASAEGNATIISGALYRVRAVGTCGSDGGQVTRQYQF